MLAIRRSRTPFSPHHPTMTLLSPQAFFPLPPCSNKMALEPPTYSPSAAVPPYSAAPGPAERTLAVSARSRRRTPTGVFTRSNKLITIALRDQEENAAQPSYGRNSTICGDIGLNCTQGVQSVSIKVEGRLHLADPHGSSVDTTFVNMFYPVGGIDGSGVCPSIFPFEFVLPEAFTDNGQRRALPPTYNLRSDLSGVRAQCNYVMKVIVKRKGGKLALWKPQKKLTIPFTYRSRFRPPQPILPSPFPFLSTIKSLPEEWFQVTSTMAVKPHSDIEPIDCHLFIPVVQTYALTDTIPFYLQLIAPPKSLQAFLYPTIPNHAKLKRSKSNAAEAATSPPTVRVYLMRQVTVVLKGQHSIRKCTIGEGTLRSLPPGAPMAPPLLRSQPLDAGLSTLDYEGEVRANSDVTVGQFVLSRVQVRDFMTVYLAPPNQYTSPLNPLQHSHPIRLVTDSFADTTDHESHAS
ncbi:hypothetical protein BJY52DRAFT_1243651 [Lactarius psammicola]|nr:hypothetical protein BJY52DRAFT_1243651 [Lactarius psammicola]